jgi:hypothetical protein
MPEWLFPYPDQVAARALVLIKLERAPHFWLTS